MKILERILMLAGSILVGFYIMKEALAIHLFLGGIIFGVTISAALYIMYSHIKQ